MDSKYKGIVGIVSGDLARYPATYDSLLQLEAPLNCEVVFRVVRGAVAENRNILGELAVKEDADWVCYLDDDQVFPSDLLINLVGADKDVVSGLYLHRDPPFKALVGDNEDERGWWYSKSLEAEDRGLRQRLTVGAGCLMVRTKVFQSLEKPWWRVGQIEPDHNSDDVDFCRRVRRAGFEIWCDYDTLVGHIATCTVWPFRDSVSGEWGTKVLRNNRVIATFPAACDSRLDMQMTAN